MAVKLVERQPHMWEIGSLVFGRVKPMTDKISAYCFLARRLALTGYSYDWLAQYQKYTTELDIEPDFPVDSTNSQIWLFVCLTTPTKKK